MAPPQPPGKGKKTNKNNNNTSNGDEPQDKRANEGATQKDGAKEYVPITIDSVKDPRTGGTSYQKPASDASSNSKETGSKKAREEVTYISSDTGEEVPRASSSQPAEPTPPKTRIQDPAIGFVERSLSLTESEPAASVPRPPPTTAPSAAVSLSASQEQPPAKDVKKPAADPSKPAGTKTESSAPTAEDQKITPAPEANTAAPALGESTSWADLDGGTEDLILNHFAAIERRLKQFGKPESLAKLKITPETLPNVYGGVTKITKEVVAEFDALQQTILNFLEEAEGQAPSSVRVQLDKIMSAQHSIQSMRELFEKSPNRFIDAAGSGLSADMKEPVKFSQELMAQVKPIAAQVKAAQETLSQGKTVFDKVQTLVQKLEAGESEIVNNAALAAAKHVEDSRTGERFMSEVRQELAKNRHAYQELLQAISGSHQSTRNQLSQVTQKLDECAQQNQQLSDRMDRLEKQQKLLDPLNSFEKRGMFAKNIYDEVLTAVEGILRGHTAEEETKEGQSFSPLPAQTSETQWPAEVGLRPSVRAALEQVSTADRQTLNNQPAAMRFLRESSEPTALGFLKEPQYLKVLLTDAELCLRSLSE